MARAPVDGGEGDALAQGARTRRGSAAPAGRGRPRAWGVRRGGRPRGPAAQRAPGPGPGRARGRGRPRWSSGVAREPAARRGRGRLGPVGLRSQRPAREPQAVTTRATTRGERGPPAAVVVMVRLYHRRGRGRRRPGSDAGGDADAPGPRRRPPGGASGRPAPPRPRPRRRGARAGAGERPGPAADADLGGRGLHAHGGGQVVEDPGHQRLVVEGHRPVVAVAADRGPQQGQVRVDGQVRPLAGHPRAGREQQARRRAAPGSPSRPAPGRSRRRARPGRSAPPTRSRRRPGWTRRPAPAGRSRGR